jgi:transcriptional regulator with XRE-family HTH domain
MFDIAKRLKFLMNKTNTNVNQLAKCSGVSQPVLHRISSGELIDPKFSLLVKISNALNIPVHEMYSTDASNLEKVTAHIVPWGILPKIPNQSERTFLQKMSVDGTPQDNLLATVLPDGSMAPLYPQGSTVIFSPAVTAKHGQCVLVEIKGKVYARMLHKSKKSIKFIPLSQNYQILEEPKAYSILGVITEVSLSS